MTRMTSRLQLFLMGSALTLLAACASGPTPVPEEAPAATGSGSTGSTPAVTKPSISSGPSSGDAAVEAVLRQARTARDSGNYSLCLSRLDRALRIAPEHAAIYLELARCHTGAGNVDQAAASAERGLVYCSSSRSSSACKALGDYLP